MKTLILVFVATFACVASSAFAQADDLRARGDRACNGDARRLCGPVLGKGDDAVLQCFRSKRKMLSDRCSKFLREVGAL